MAWDPESVLDPQAESTFLDSILTWDEVGDEPHAELLQLNRDLLRLRGEVPGLSDPRFPDVGVEWDDNAGWFLMRRGEHAIVVVNFDTDVALIVLPECGETEQWAIRLGRHAEIVDDQLRLGGHGLAVVQRTLA